MYFYFQMGAFPFKAAEDPGLKVHIHNFDLVMKSPRPPALPTLFVLDISKYLTIL